MEPKSISLKLQSGENIFAWYVNPPTTPRAVICLCHGWGEHSLRYKEWADRFVSEEYAFVAWDHFGHGQSEGKRGHIPNYSVFMEEINLAIGKANQLFPGTPVVLYGHSMGGNIAINFALRESIHIKLLIATSPWIELANEPSSIMGALVRVLNRIAPGLQITAPLNADGICHVKEEVEHYKTDPLNHSKITPRLLTEISKGGKSAVENIGEFSKPFLLLHGDADPITSYSASKELLKNCSTCSFVPFKDMYHELHNEHIKSEVFNVIKQWLTGNLDDLK
jgi:alpha-beta hydrolase superfamily lysophospholipase